MRDLSEFEPTIGNCYSDCLELIIEWVEDGFVLCHGIARLTRDDGNTLAGTRFGHAWLESGEFVLDHKRTDKLIPRAVYYSAGGIDPDTVVRYTRLEAVCMSLSEEHCGPWHDHPEDVAFN